MGLDNSARTCINVNLLGCPYKGVEIIKRENEQYAPSESYERHICLSVPCLWAIQKNQVWIIEKLQELQDRLQGAPA